ncbi:DUF4199 domain-containing protein [Lacibacter sp. MH-610]|uniref:DUF4199 domain-containing protein n=1 Tax=Lacibacter sp. MH-610 TaxID=3020883 RepID=UPI003891F358
MEKKTNSPMIQYGLLSGLLGIIMFLILYLGGTKLFTSPIAYAGYLIPIIFAVLACVKEKKAKGGFLKFGEALKTSFGVFVITSLLSTLFTYILMNYIDTEFATSMKSYTMEVTENMMKKFGASQTQIDEAVKKASEKDQFSLGSMLLGFSFGCIFWFVISLIISLIVRKENKEGMPQSM